jgi:hypothetical protein
VQGSDAGEAGGGVGHGGGGPPGAGESE